MGGALYISTVNVTYSFVTAHAFFGGDNRATTVTDESRGDSHMKGVGMLVVSLRGVNFGFWSQLGCSRHNAIIVSRQGLV